MNALSSRHAMAMTAADQNGYFTAQQAIDAGYSYQAQHYHVATGEWIRVAVGVFRLRDFPDQPWEELVVLTLRSRNRGGEPQAVASHETALSIHEISDANPAKIHLTVPLGFRKRMPPVVILHRATLVPSDWEQRDGYRVTTPIRTIADIAASEVSWPLLEGAVRDALRTGLVRKQRLLELDGSDELTARLRAAITSVERTDTVERR